MVKSWSVSLEHEEYENDIDLLVKDAIDAIEQTSSGCYVNVVTPGTLGNPDDYLTEALDLIFSDKIKTKFIDQCGCGGYVLRVWKK
ncbi:CGCGG family rSAM-modified RiPP protein [Bacillus sp. EB600]|uniref:CGCGG family putative rSAM-modified RiPP protein n=1 Tax=Bacillus sp. EB600 TaxID=2806345 RepID=UPI00210B48CB|nr:CGCGG family rSAM-modified RiPP protein [Bacillus sp. EB600]MCQ6279250.1 CGCGG family rSAM-modified RiPP protein [Bacillus sp. EB600]